MIKLPNYNYKFKNNKTCPIIKACVYTKENIHDVMNFIEKIIGLHNSKVIKYDDVFNEYWLKDKNDDRCSTLMRNKTLIYDEKNKWFLLYPTTYFNEYYVKV